MSTTSPPSTISTKKAFGAFVIAKRQAAGLTQRQLAERLFVTESAVSKWERGVSYPDISLVAALARELGVSEAELINASEDLVGRRVEREALFYRRWKRSILWTTTVGYALALVTCLIVNLAVDHTLTWFWVVLAAVAVAYSLTTLPLLPVAERGWTVVGAFLLGLGALLVIVRLLYSDGHWLPIAITAVLFAVLVLLAPVALRGLVLPAPLTRHRTVLALAADTLGLGILLLVIFWADDDLHTLTHRALPIAALAILFVWVPALVIRYLPVAGLLQAAVVIAFVGVYEFSLFNPLVRRILDEHPANPIDLSRWHDPYINGNVSVVVVLTSLAVAGVLAVLGGTRQSR